MLQSTRLLRLRLANYPMTRSIRQLFLISCLCGVSYTSQASDLAVVPGGAATNPADAVIFWDQMSAQQRASLWPLLTHEQRLFQWRYMTKDERREMRRNMTHQERQAIKHRYVIDGKAVGAVRSMPVRKMTESERQLLRRQIMEVHVEIRRGVPYNCTDPTDCPKSAFRTRAAERMMHEN